MPRLVGKTSKTPLYVGIALVSAIVVAGALEYSGTIDLVPGFGQSNRVRRLSGSATENPMTP